MKLIEGVIDILDKKIVRTDITRYSEWLSDPKVIGNRVIRVDIFFTIRTKTTVRDLVQSQIEFLKSENVRVEIKQTNNKHTTRIGYLIGPVVDWANINWYKENCKAKAQIVDGALELKKE